MIYEAFETVIPLCLVLLKNNGTPDTGKTVTIHIFNDRLGTKPISGGAVPEILAGFYRYNFTHGAIINTTFSYYMIDGSTVVASGKFRVITTKQDLTNTIDFADGQAI